MLRRPSRPTSHPGNDSTDSTIDSTSTLSSAGITSNPRGRRRRPDASTLSGAQALRIGAAVAVLGGVTVTGTSLLNGPLNDAARAENVVRPTAAEAAFVSGVLDDGAQRQQAATDAAQAATTKAAADRAAAAKAAAAKAAAARAAQVRAAAQKAAAERAAAQQAAERRAQAARAARDAARDPKSAARVMVAAKGWGSGQFSCLNSLWTKESGWNVHADNPSSSAYGIPQALPGSKMASAGSDWQANPVTQIRWGLTYISQTYGTPCSAWAHSQANNWY